MTKLESKTAILESIDRIRAQVDIGNIERLEMIAVFHGGTIDEITYEPKVVKRG